MINIIINRTRISKWIYSAIPIRWQWRVEKREKTPYPDIYQYTVNYEEDRSGESFNAVHWCTETELYALCDKYVEMINRLSGVRVR
jgi:hypothetical protein